MRKSWTWIACGVAFAGTALVSVPRTAQARPNYLNMGFVVVYPQLKDAATAEGVKCNVCHFGEKKTNRNDYGKAVGEALGATKVTDAKAIEEALKKAEAGKSSVEGKTFGDLIKMGKLPGKNP